MRRTGGSIERARASLGWAPTVGLREGLGSAAGLVHDQEMREIHILYVIDSVMMPGGAEQSLALLAPEYRRLGVRLDVATLYERPGHQEALHAAGARLFSAGGRGGVPAHVARCRSLIRHVRPDLVHTTLYEADIAGRLAAWLTRTPVVSSLVNVAYGPEHFADPSAGTWRLRAAGAFDTLTASRAVRMHAVSERVAELMAPRLHYPRGRIDVVVRGRSPEVLGVRTEARRAAARASLGLEASDRALLAVAREEHQKGLDVLLGALPTVLRAEPRARLLIADAARGAVRGTPSNSATPRSRAAGDLPRHARRRTRLLCAADVFTLPSRRRDCREPSSRPWRSPLQSWRATSPRCARSSGPSRPFLCRPIPRSAWLRVCSRFLKARRKWVPALRRLASGSLTCSPSLRQHGRCGPSMTGRLPEARRRNRTILPMAKRLRALVFDLLTRTRWGRHLLPSYIYMYSPAQLAFLVHALDETEMVEGALLEVGCFRARRRSI